MTERNPRKTMLWSIGLAMATIGAIIGINVA